MNRILAIILIFVPSLALSQQRGKGFPSHAGVTDLRTEFQNPPAGYGNVPFYWWEGDTLKRDRLLYQLNELSDVVDGFAVSYNHTHPKVDREANAHGYGSYGRADGGQPDFFSDEWWDLWQWFSAECGKRNLGVGIDDYVVGWPGNGYYPDDIRADQGVTAYLGRLVMADAADSNHVDNVVYKDDKHVIYAVPSYELHPEYGSKMVENFFGRFEDKMDDSGRAGLNYFFQDELQYGLTMHSWSEDMPQQFLDRKGYDIVPYLPALFIDMGDITPKVRMDYADVLTHLADERYFQPIFNWHNDRGLIYGCDNNGRGLDPLQYLDYFHAISWYTAPGNDAPARGSSFRQTKVSSSVAHLYQRPRTWLEAFYSMGWDCNGKWLTSQLDRHIIAGGNLLCMHGLYYSTHGGWWEWAPPCFHFRMPYWPHMKHWLKYSQRLCYLLSQGVHVCDIAVLYPTETLQAYPDSKIDIMWQLADSLSTNGLDYDFVDRRSIDKAKMKVGEMSIADEQYKALVLADVKAMHYSTMKKVKDFASAGGLVVILGQEPIATTKAGANDPDIVSMLDEIYSCGGLHVDSVEEAVEVIEARMHADFRNLSGKATVLHRRIGEYDAYMVMDAAKGDTLSFRSIGKVEKWDAASGQTETMPVISQDNGFTHLRFDGDYGQSRLYVFSPGMPDYCGNDDDGNANISTIAVDGDWEVEYVPTMDNRWGDFRLPASMDTIGLEAREFVSRAGGDTISTTSIYGYAPYMEVAHIDGSENVEKLLGKGISLEWRPYAYSWQYGVFDNPGEQGYHGLKGKVDDRFLILDHAGHMAFRTKVQSPCDGAYKIVQMGVKPSYLIIDGSICSDSIVNLAKGWHDMDIIYANTRRDPEPSYDPKSNYIDNRDRSAVVLYAADDVVPSARPATDLIVGMRWYGSKHLPYNPHPECCEWISSFETAPGVSKMHFDVAGTILGVEVDGKECRIERAGDGSFECVIDGDCSNASLVTVRSLNDVDSPGQAFFKQPVKMTAGKGIVELGDWSQYGALRFYSGGVRYTKPICLNIGEASRVLLDLGDVDATCEVSINGSEAMIGVCPPFVFDVTGKVRNGENIIEVLVYSSLSNHYQTIPSRYRGEPHSGLFGPVSILVETRKD